MIDFGFHFAERVAFDLFVVESPPESNSGEFLPRLAAVHLETDERHAGAWLPDGYSQIFRL